MCCKPQAITVRKRGSGCGSVGRAVASNTRGPQFKSSLRQTLYHLLTVNCIEKTKINKKRLGKAHFLKKQSVKGGSYFRWQCPLLGQLARVRLRSVHAHHPLLLRHRSLRGPHHSGAVSKVKYLENILKIN